MNAPGDFPYRPRARTPVFYGSFDWHSCVEMHWLLVRLLRVAPGAVPAAEIRTALGAQFERGGAGGRGGVHHQPGRPSGAALRLGLGARAGPRDATWDDQHGRKWAAALAPLAGKLGGSSCGWLPKATYPVRHGVHANSAFGLSLACRTRRRGPGGRAGAA